MNLIDFEIKHKGEKSLFYICNSKSDDEQDLILNIVTILNILDD